VPALLEAAAAEEAEDDEDEHDDEDDPEDAHVSVPPELTAG
jgi:hypothetical protein